MKSEMNIAGNAVFHYDNTDKCEFGAIDVYHVGHDNCMGYSIERIQDAFEDNVCWYGVYSWWYCETYDYGDSDLECATDTREQAQSYILSKLEQRFTKAA